MHRAYQPITPANNKLLKKRWDMTRYDLHRKKVQQASPVIDNRPPKTYMHLHLKLKQLQLEEERLATVERDNRILLEKMSYIMRSRGQVDNRNVYQHKSLHKTKRQRELLRVTHENQAILKRLTATEPIYNHVQWEEEWQINEKYMDNIAKYPKDWYTEMVKKPNPKSQPLEPIRKEGSRTSLSSERKQSQDSSGGKYHRKSSESEDKHERKESQDDKTNNKDSQSKQEQNAVQGNSTAINMIEVKVESAADVEGEEVSGDTTEENVENGNVEAAQESETEKEAIAEQ